MSHISVGYRMMLLRCEAHKTQKEVADHLGVTVQMVSQYERGVTKLPLLAAGQLAELFHCDVKDFLEEVPYAGKTGDA